MNFENMVLSEISQSEKDYAWLHLYDASKDIKLKLKETESRIMVARDWEVSRKWMGIEYQLHKMKRFRDLFTTMCI